MVVMSKALNSRFLKTAKCIELMHPWTPHCSIAAVDLILSSTRGSFKYFLIIYLLQLMLRGRSITREYLKKHLKGFVQSIFFGSMIAGSWMCTSCFFRAVLGQYYIYTAVCLPAVLSAAVTVHLERPIRRDLYAYTFFQAVLEYSVRVLELSGIGPMSRMGETLVFMICNGALLYLLRSTMSEGVAYWFFRPPTATKVKENDEDEVQKGKMSHCPHTEPCWNYILKSVAQYSGAGLGIQFLRAIITKYGQFLSAPSRTFRTVMWNREMFQLGAFLGVYIGVYKCISCLLCRYRECDADWHSAVAGFLSGCAYYIHPERAFALSAATSTLQLLINRGIQLKILPDLPHAAELIFALSCGVLFQARFVDAENCPRIIANIMATVTKGRSDYIYRMYSNRAKEFLLLLAI